MTVAIKMDEERQKEIANLDDLVKRVEHSLEKMNRRTGERFDGRDPYQDPFENPSDRVLDESNEPTLYERFAKAMKSKYGTLGMGSHLAREVGIKEFGFAIPTWETVQGLKKYGPILEVGSGLGYWAYELRRAGVDVVATDKVHPRRSTYHWGEKHHHNTRWWVQVQEMPAETAVAKYPNHTLMFVWPCYGDPWAAKALERFRGTYVIYVGEGYGGCTADARFHQLLQDNYDVVDSSEMIRWGGLHDGCTVYKRKNTFLKRRVPGQKTWHNPSEWGEPEFTMTKTKKQAAGEEKLSQRIPRKTKKAIKMLLRRKVVGRVPTQRIRVWQESYAVVFDVVGRR